MTFRAQRRRRSQASKSKRQTDDMKLYQIEHTDRFEVHHWFAPSENQVVRMFFDWCEVV